MRAQLEARRKRDGSPVNPRWLLLLLGLLLAACAELHIPELPLGSSAQLPALRILLTNDDGVGAPGLEAMRKELQGAGHDVVVVAPSANRSGSGVSITTSGTLVLHELEPGVYSLDGTPADCVRVALESLLEEPVELVVSGVNFGQNVGAGTVSSGTVGAAITAANFGVPAIAASQMVDPEDLSRTESYFPDAAGFVRELVATLALRNRSQLLPPRTVLNVNHPARTRDDVRGVKLTRQGEATLYTLAYEPTAQGDLQVSFTPSDAEERIPDADTTAIADGYISLTPLDGSWTATSDVRSRLRDLPDALEAAVP